MDSGSSVSRFSDATRLSSLAPGMRGVVRKVVGDAGGRADRLAALGVTPGASVEVLQAFPGMVLRCDETEVAVEPAVAEAILVDLQE
jgi:Fe2+ transport system protein FeoA